jgi:hypothetical protein
MPSEVAQRLIVLSQQMADLTAPECAGKGPGSCRRPHSCCDEMYCESTRAYARESWHVELPETGHPTLPFMGPEGCTVAPHLRPLCTVHTCQIASLGFKPNDPEWTERYFELRNQLDELLGQVIE